MDVGPNGLSFSFRLFGNVLFGGECCCRSCKNTNTVARILTMNAVT